MPETLEKLNLGTTPEQHRVQLDELMNCVDFSDKLIIDLGCGSGRLTIPLAFLAKEVVAVDFIKSFIQEIEQKAKKYGLSNVKTINDYCWNVFPEFANKFDIVLISGVFLHLNEPEAEALLANASNLLKQNGVVLIRESVGMPDHFEFDGYAKELKCRYQAIYRSTREFGELFDSFGFFPITSKHLYQQRPETGTYLWVLIRS